MSIYKNSALNAVAFFIPTAITIPAFGVLSRALGVEKFGIYTIAFAILGYASIIDLGLSRAVIREIASVRGDQKMESVIFGTSWKIVFGTSVLATVLALAFMSPILGFMSIDKGSMQDVERGMYFCFLSFPLLMVNQVMLAYLEGKEEFLLLTKQRIVTATVSAIIPAALCYIYKNSFFWAGVGIFIGKVYTLAVTFFIMKNTMPTYVKGIGLKIFIRMLRFGGWLTITNIISPMMVYFDRFIASNMLGANLVGYYTGPSELVSRMGAVPMAITRALFPKLSSEINTDNRKKYINQTAILIFFVAFVLAFVFLFFAEKILLVWLGEKFAGSDAVMILKILLVGFFFNSLAQIPFTVLQADGRSRLTAYIHCAEVIPYLAILYWLIKGYGLVGVAVAWTARVMFDYAIMQYFYLKSAKARADD